MDKGVVVATRAVEPRKSSEQHAPSPSSQQSTAAHLALNNRIADKQFEIAGAHTLQRLCIAWLFPVNLVLLGLVYVGVTFLPWVPGRGRLVLAVVGTIGVLISALLAVDMWWNQREGIRKKSLELTKLRDAKRLLL